MLLLDILLSFAKVGLLAFGGGPAMIPLLQSEIVEFRAWVTDEQFRAALAIGNMLPGPIMPEMAVFIGWKAAGPLGAIMAILGIVGPGVILMAFGTSLLLQMQSLAWVQGAIRGAGFAVVGLLAWTTYDQAYKVFIKGTSLDWWQVLIGGWDRLAIVVVVFLLTIWKPNLMPPLAIIGAAIYGALFLKP